MATWTCLACGEIMRINYRSKCDRCGSKSLSVEGHVKDMDEPKQTNTRGPK